MIVDMEKTVLYANNMAANGFADLTEDTLVGKNLKDLLPKKWLEERDLYFQRAVETGRVITLLEIIEGVRLCRRIKSIVVEHDGREQTLIMYTIDPVNPESLPWIRATTPAEDLFDSKNVDLGLLNMLSKRELEVLALMGQGLRQKEIAEKLFRSVSTINRHRENIGDKLGITDRAVLISLARLANLELSDATKNRVNLNDQSFSLRRFNKSQSKENENQGDSEPNPQ